MIYLLYPVDYLDLSLVENINGTECHQISLTQFTLLRFCKGITSGFKRFCKFSWKLTEINPSTRSLL